MVNKIVESIKNKLNPERDRVASLLKVEKRVIDSITLKEYRIDVSIRYGSIVHRMLEKASGKTLCDLFKDGSSVAIIEIIRYKAESNTHAMKSIRRVIEAVYNDGRVIFGFPSSAKDGEFMIVKKELAEKAYNKLFNIDNNIEKKFNVARWEILHQPVDEISLDNVVEIIVKPSSCDGLKNHHLDGVSVIPDWIADLTVEKYNNKAFEYGFKGLLYNNERPFGAKGIFIPVRVYNKLRKISPNLPAIKEDVITVFEGSYKWGNVHNNTVNVIYVHSHLVRSENDGIVPVQIWRFANLNIRADRFIKVFKNINDIINTPDVDDVDGINISNSDVYGRDQVRDILNPEYAYKKENLVKAYSMLAKKLTQLTFSPHVTGARSRILICIPLPKNVAYVDDNVLLNEKYVWLNRNPLLHPAALYRLERRSIDLPFVIVDEFLAADNDGDTVTVFPDIFEKKINLGNWESFYEKGNAPVVNIFDVKDVNNYSWRVMNRGMLVSIANSNYLAFYKIVTRDNYKAVFKTDSEPVTILNKYINCIQGVTIALKHSFQTDDIEKRVSGTILKVDSVINDNISLCGDIIYDHHRIPNKTKKIFKAINKDAGVMLSADDDFFCDPFDDTPANDDMIDYLKNIPNYLGIFLTSYTNISEYYNDNIRNTLVETINKLIGVDSLVLNTMKNEMSKFVKNDDIIIDRNKAILFGNILVARTRMIAELEEAKKIEGASFKRYLFDKVLLCVKDLIEDNFTAEEAYNLISFFFSLGKKYKTTAAVRLFTDKEKTVAGLDTSIGEIFRGVPMESFIKHVFPHAYVKFYVDKGRVLIDTLKLSDVQ